MKIYMGVICGIGSPANIPIIVNISKFQSRCPASFLLCFLAVIDSSAPVAKLIERNIWAHDVERGRFGCETIGVPFRTLTVIRNWTVVVICAERCIAVCEPFKRNVWISKRRRKRALSLIS
ncbi:unnamed protein product, partial [Lymnaea stagnalis]